MRSVIALFCEDIREEKSGTVNLIGIFPDNINVSGFPFSFAKLAIYVRLRFPVEESPPKNVAVRLVDVDDNVTHLPVFGEQQIINAIDEARGKGSPAAGLIATAIMVGLPIRRAGQMRVFAKIDDTDHICGTLRIFEG